MVFEKDKLIGWGRGLLQGLPTEGLEIAILQNGYDLKILASRFI